MTTEVRARTSLDMLAVPLAKELSIENDELAAVTLRNRLQVWNEIDRLYAVSFVERGLIVLAFERRMLWRFLVDSRTGEPFVSFTAWMGSDALGCRSVNYEAKRRLEELQDIPAGKLIEVPKSNIKTLTKLSGSVRQRDDVLEDARTLSREAFEDKIRADYPTQHLESVEPLRFFPTTSQRADIEEAVALAMEDGADNRTEALWLLAIAFKLGKVSA